MQAPSLSPIGGVGVYITPRGLSDYCGQGLHPVQHHRRCHIMAYVERYWAAGPWYYDEIGRDDGNTWFSISTPLGIRTGVVEEIMIIQQRTRRATHGIGRIVFLF